MIALQAASVIHTDFGKPLFSAQTISDQNLVYFGTFVNAKHKGFLRSVG